MRHNFVALAFRKDTRLSEEHKDEEKVNAESFPSLLKYGYHYYFQEKTFKLHKTVSSEAKNISSKLS